MSAARDKELERWRQMWREGHTPFHRDDVNPTLVEFGDELLAGGPHRILVPLCGKSVDLAWLADRGHEVVGIELVEDAVRGVFRERGWEPEIETIDRLAIYRRGALTIVCGNIFEIDRSHIGSFDRIWDRAALIALPAHIRGDYTRHLRQLVRPGWSMLVSAVEYDTTALTGPPFSVPEEEIRLHVPGASVQVLSRRDDLETPAHLRERGQTWWRESTYLIRDASGS
jgi:thiopurine S-methyltransferase